MVHQMGPGTSEGGIISRGSAGLKRATPRQGTPPALSHNRGGPASSPRKADHPATVQQSRTEKVGGPMNPTLAHLLVGLYPRPWRERYGAEFEGLLHTRGCPPPRSPPPRLPAMSYLL